MTGAKALLNATAFVEGTVAHTKFCLRHARLADIARNQAPDGTLQMIAKTMLSDQIRDTILKRILSGAYAQGDRIVEAQLVKEFKVSQSPIREALRDLAAMQFVELEPFKGARVRRISSEEILQTYPVRAALEELAGRLAATAFAGNVKSLQAIYEKMISAAYKCDIAELVHLDAQLHREILEATGNAPLIKVWESLMIESWTYVTAVKIIPSDMDLMTVVEMHLPLIDALQAGDADRAAHCMKAHILSFADMLQKEIGLRSDVIAASKD